MSARAQTVEVVDQQQKESRLPQLLQKYHSSRKNRVLVFALYKKEAARIEQMLQRQKLCSVSSRHKKPRLQQRSKD